MGDVGDWVGGRRGDEELVLEGLPVALLGGDWRGTRWQFEPLEGGDLRRHGRILSAAVVDRDVVAGLQR